MKSPLVPLDIFRSRQFSGANGTTFVVYAALGVALFLIVVELQTVLGYSALAAGPPPSRSRCSCCFSRPGPDDCRSASAPAFR